MAGLDYIHPEMIKRFTRLVRWAWSNSWDVGVNSGARSYSQQKDWYTQYLNGTWPYGLVADPDRISGPSPWGWIAKGSLHMIQADGYAHALDINWIGTTAQRVHEQAYKYGLRFVEPTENWHCQWWDFRSGIFPVLEEDDMTPEEYAHSLGLHPDPDNPMSGVYGVMLLEEWDPSTGHAAYKWYPYSEAIKFIHQEMKMQRLS